MRRKLARPYGQSVTGMRTISMLMAMLILWMLYTRLKDPTTWRAFADDKETISNVAEKAPPQEAEVIIPGPNDLDEEEAAKVQEMFEFVTDRAPLKSVEMNAYWRLMEWSRTQPFSELEKRCQNDILFTQIWEEPEKYRAMPIRLRIHVRQVVKWDAKDKPPGIENVYEAWGPTDESSSFPYVVLFPDKPNDLPTGNELRAEIVFVGYFLKIMTYTAHDNKTRGAPLLVGRVRLISVPTVSAPSKTDPWVLALIAVGGTLFIGYSIWMGTQTRRKPKVTMLPQELSVMESSDGPAFDNPFGQIVATEPPTENVPPVTTETVSSSPPK